jgi:glycosyltransferase involved in cell wall biosynthesis
MSATSVVMATYNGERYLPAQLESLLHQTILPGQLIISDDGSQDQTVQIAEEFARRAPFPTIVLKNPKRLGYADNFLQAALHAKEDYISFCDQDDIWHSNKIERCICELQRTGSLLCVHAVRLIDAQSKPHGVHTQGAAKDAVFDALMLPPWGIFLGFTQTFERRLLNIVDSARRGADNHTASGLLSHDRWVYLLASSFGRVVALAEPLADYRQHQSNQFGQKTTLFDSLRGALTESYDRLAKHRDIAAFRADLFSQMARETEDQDLVAACGRAHSYWRHLTALYDLRMVLYGSKRLTERIGCFRQLIAAGAYKSYSQGGLDRKTKPKDFILGLLQGWHYLGESSSSDGG